MVCKSCNTENAVGMNFCGKCGARLEVAFPAVPVVGDEGAFYCARHKKTPTRLRCGRCDKPICTSCVVHGPAGVRCRDCARNRVPLRPMGMLNEAGRQVDYTFNRTLARYGVLGLIVVFSLARWVLSAFFAATPAIHRPPATVAAIIPIVDHDTPTLNPLDWKSFLQKYSHDSLIVNAWNGSGAPEAKWLKQHTLSVPGASEGQIVAAEQHLGRHLPPSYRAFLKTSNGWRSPGRAGTSGNLIGVQHVMPLLIAHPEWVQGWVTQGAQVSPEQHLRQRGNASNFRGSYLVNAVLISDYGDDGFICLCPDVKTTDGEWECWMLGSEGVIRYPSFQAWMMAQQEAVHQAYRNGERHGGEPAPTGDDNS